MSSHPFASLTPDTVLDAVESLGLRSDARIMALNSYENRVFQVGIEDGEPLIAKFYRPQACGLRHDGGVTSHQLNEATGRLDLLLRNL